MDQHIQVYFEKSCLPDNHILLEPWSRGLKTCSSMTPDSPDWVTWVKRGLNQGDMGEKNEITAYNEQNSLTFFVPFGYFTT
jgi:hypothetical protein